VDEGADVVDTAADVLVPWDACFELLEQAATPTARESGTIRLRPKDLVLFLMTWLSSDLTRNWLKVGQPAVLYLCHTRLRSHQPATGTGISEWLWRKPGRLSMSGTDDLLANNERYVT
jgi:hypothetical protein